MTLENVWWALLPLGLLVVLLTRLRLGRGRSGRGAVGRGLLDLHTLNGLLASGLAVVYLVGDGARALGVVVVALWVLEALLGLTILLRWLPAHGRHVSRQSSDGWTDGPWLSIVAHVGLTLGVAVVVYAFVTGRV